MEWFVAVPQQGQEDTENVSPSVSSESLVLYVVWSELKKQAMPVQLFEE